MTDESPGLFRGSEFSRMLILAAVAIGGWAWLWQMSGRLGVPEDEPVRVEGPPPAVVPDRSVEFESVTDKTPLSLRDNAAYALLLGKARERSANELAKEARRDVGFVHVWERPESYRGVPMHLLGNARRIIRYDSKLARGGWLYEAWIFTPESQNHPYICVFEDAPQGLPIGAQVAERVVFNGYFLKLMKYQAGDVPRAAPLLVGRLGWTPQASGTGWSLRSTGWAAAAIGALLLYTLFRWTTQFRRAFAGPRHSAIRFDRPVEEIEPDALAAWVENVSETAERNDPRRKPTDDEPGPALDITEDAP